MSGGISRRDVVLGGAAASVASAVQLSSSARATTGTGSLKAIAASRGIQIGACFNTTMSAAYQTLIAREVDVLSPEWSLKPRFLKPDRGARYRFKDADAIYRFCGQHGLALHGHTLFWHAEPLAWADTPSFARVKRDYGGLLEDVMTRYARAISWDVANEIIADPGKDLRTQPIIATHGDDFVVFLFTTARRLAPAAKLCLNDYNLECGRDWCAAKRDRLLAVVDRLRARRMPLDVIGLQGHLSSQYGIDIKGTLAFLDAIASRGLEAYITELDINDIAFDDGIAARDRQVAALYSEYLTAVLAHPVVKRVTFWGLADIGHHVMLTNDGTTRGVSARPALFDAALAPKPAYFAVAEALAAAPAR